jgi:hypothetical protein
MVYCLDKRLSQCDNYAEKRKVCPFFIVLNIQNYNFACGSVWVWNLVSDIKGGT